MSRIAPEPVTQRKPPLRDRRYLDSAEGRPCDCCASVGTTVFCHDRRGQTGGMARKPDDWCGAFGCADCHREHAANPKESAFWTEASLTMAREMIIPVRVHNTAEYHQRLMKRRYDEWKGQQ